MAGEINNLWTESTVATDPVSGDSQVLDIPIEKMSTVPWGMFAFVIAVIVASTALLIIFAPGSRKTFGPPLAAIPVFVAVFGSVFFQRWRNVRILKKAVAASSDRSFAALMYDSGRAINIRMGPQSLVKLCERIAQRGDVGKTVRMWWTLRPPAPVPLTIPFEPRLLNEADEGFAGLADAASDGVGAPSNSPFQPPSRNATESGPSNPWRRNVLLKGGWLMVGVFGFNFVMALIEAIAMRRVTWRVCAWAFGLVMFIVAPASGLLAPRQWLLVPGGLVVRKARRRIYKTELHLFDRRNSILCTYQNRTKNWYVVVANATKSFWTLATPREAEILLRAWLSPLTPPTVEHLADFA